MRRQRLLVYWFLLTLVCACGENDHSKLTADRTGQTETTNPQKTPEKPPGAPLPEDAKIIPGTRFSVDMRQDDVPFPVMGSAQHRILARLTHANGRRSLYVRDVQTGTEELALGEDWYANVVGAMSSDGKLAVCATRLTGTPTQLTEGELPDPRHGMSLICTRRVHQTWDPPASLSPESGAYIVVNILATPNKGFALRVLYDTTGLIVVQPRPGDGWFRVSYTDGQLKAPQLIKLLLPTAQ